MSHEVSNTCCLEWKILLHTSSRLGESTNNGIESITNYFKSVSTVRSNISSKFFFVNFLTAYRKRHLLLSDLQYHRKILGNLALVVLDDDCEFLETYLDEWEPIFADIELLQSNKSLVDHYLIFYTSSFEGNCSTITSSMEKLIQSDKYRGRQYSVIGIPLCGNELIDSLKKELQNFLSSFIVSIFLNIETKLCMLRIQSPSTIIYNSLPEVYTFLYPQELSQRDFKRLSIVYHLKLLGDHYLLLCEYFQALCCYYSIFNHLDDANDTLVMGAVYEGVYHSGFFWKTHVDGISDNFGVYIDADFSSISKSSFEKANEVNKLISIIKLEDASAVDLDMMVENAIFFYNRQFNKGYIAILDLFMCYIDTLIKQKRVNRCMLTLKRLYEQFSTLELKSNELFFSKMGLYQIGGHVRLGKFKKAIHFVNIYLKVPGMMDALSLENVDLIIGYLRVLLFTLRIQVEGNKDPENSYLYLVPGFRRLQLMMLSAMQLCYQRKNMYKDDVLVSLVILRNSGIYIQKTKKDEIWDNLKRICTIKDFVIKEVHLIRVHRFQVQPHFVKSAMPQSVSKFNERISNLFITSSFKGKRGVPESTKLYAAVGDVVTLDLVFCTAAETPVISVKNVVIVAQENGNELHVIPVVPLSTEPVGVVLSLVPFIAGTFTITGFSYQCDGVKFNFCLNECDFIKLEILDDLPKMELNDGIELSDLYLRNVQAQFTIHNISKLPLNRVYIKAINDVDHNISGYIEKDILKEPIAPGNKASFSFLLNSNVSMRDPLESPLVIVTINLLIGFENYPFYQQKECMIQADFYFTLLMKNVAFRLSNNSTLLVEFDIYNGDQFKMFSFTYKNNEHIQTVVISPSSSYRIQDMEIDTLKFHELMKLLNGECDPIVELLGQSMRNQLVYFQGNFKGQYVSWQKSQNIYPRGSSLSIKQKENTYVQCFIDKLVSSVMWNHEEDIIELNLKFNEQVFDESLTLKLNEINRYTVTLKNTTGMPLRNLILKINLTTDSRGLKLCNNDMMWIGSLKHDIKELLLIDVKSSSVDILFVNAGEKYLVCDLLILRNEFIDMVNKHCKHGDMFDGTFLGIDYSKRGFYRLANKIFKVNVL